jgi:hypothetical protein
MIEIVAFLFCLRVVGVEEFHDSSADIEFRCAAFLVGYC